MSAPARPGVRADLAYLLDAAAFTHDAWRLARRARLRPDDHAAVEQLIWLGRQQRRVEGYRAARRARRRLVAQWAACGRCAPGHPGEPRFPVHAAGERPCAHVDDVDADPEELS